MSRNNFFMEMALNLAFQNMGKTSPNPSVGAVITFNGEIVSKGATSTYGSDHAEIVAMKNATVPLQNCEIFVSLEPCSHYGKTPPCVDAIIREKFKKVHIPILDPNPVVAGRGMKKLTDAGIEVNLMSKYKNMAEDLIRPFKKYILSKKPFILHKTAMTLDGRIATTSGDSKWISSKASRLLVHRLRSKVDAIIVGKNTLIKDNPSLNVRFKDFNDEVASVLKNGLNLLNGYNNFFVNSLLNDEVFFDNTPLRVVLGLPSLLNPKVPFFKDNNYLIFATKNQIANYKKNDTNIDINKLNIKLFQTEDNSSRVDFFQSELVKKGIMFALLEGGSGVNSFLFDGNAIDQFLYFYAPKIAGNGISLFHSKDIESMSEAKKITDITAGLIDSDFFVSGYNK